MQTKTITLVSPDFVEAKNPKELVIQMRDLILRNGKQYDFYFFQKLPNGKERAWYREEIEFTYTEHLKARSKNE